jgi:hypothetical protein
MPVQEDQIMARGSKAAYSGKQKRKASHIEQGVRKRGGSEGAAKRIAWATVNKESGGGKKSGSGRGHAVSHEPSRKGGRRAHAHRSQASYAKAGRKAARTRRKAS